MKLYKMQNTEKKIVERVADAPKNSLVYLLLPTFLLPYAQLARWDRPIGWQLLFWPCSWSMCLAAINLPTNQDLSFFSCMYTILLFFFGAICMRGAGCTYNDLVDAPIDAQVARTKSRPLPAKRISSLHAWCFLFLQLAISFIILLQFNTYTILIGFCSIPFIILYPFMKRIAHYPQVFIGICFSWGALMGWSSLTHDIGIVSFLLYLGCFLWVIGYDTIYAHQDKEDDALLGIGSTALLFAEETKLYLSFLYAGAFMCWFTAFYITNISTFSLLALCIVGIHMAKQIYQLNIHNSKQCLKIFRSNTQIGFFLFFFLFINLLYKLFIVTG